MWLLIAYEYALLFWRRRCLWESTDYFCTCGGSQVFPPFPASRIFVTSSDQVSRSAANCSANGSRSAKGRSSMSKFLKGTNGIQIRLSQGPAVLLLASFQELYGSTRRNRRGRYSGGLRRTWPSHSKWCFSTLVTTSLLILQSWRIPELDIDLAGILSIWRENPCLHGSKDSYYFNYMDEKLYQI